ncbi:hypothetical protein GLP23_16420 [Photobacterium carnosum]|nr:hypothetical protein [Photobacterium carnosum]
MAQTPKERKDAIAKAVRANRLAAKNKGKRVDVFVKKETKDGLKILKLRYSDINNEAQAVDKAVELALKHL